MKDFHDPYNIVNNVDPDYIRQDILIEEKRSNLFTIGQSYDDGPCREIVCKICEGNQFHVGIGDCYTGIKCIACKWEFCIHEG